MTSCEWTLSQTPSVGNRKAPEQVKRDSLVASSSAGPRNPLCPIPSVQVGRARREMLARVIPRPGPVRNCDPTVLNQKMTKNDLSRLYRAINILVFSGSVCATLAPTSHAQLLTFSKTDLTDYTSQTPFDRSPDGRPRVPDDLIERARSLSSEEVWACLSEKKFDNQYAEGFVVLHPGKTLVGRAFTLQFMPSRPDVEDTIQVKAKVQDIGHLHNQTAIDMLQPGDVLVVDLFGKKVGGTIVGDNLFYYSMKATKGGGLVVDGAIRDLEGISQIDMPAYFRAVDPTPIGDVMLTGINVPVRIGGPTVMPRRRLFHSHAVCKGNAGPR